MLQITTLKQCWYYLVLLPRGTNFAFGLDVLKIKYTYMTQ